MCAETSNFKQTAYDRVLAHTRTLSRDDEMLDLHQQFSDEARQKMPS
jgi:hypothetical protein